MYPQAIYFSEDPIVASETSTFQPYKGWGMLKARSATPTDGAAHGGGGLAYARVRRSPELMVRAVEALGLDFAAVDYARLSDGSLVLWEAKPHPAMPVWRHMALPVARRLRRRWGRLRAEWSISLTVSPDLGFMRPAAICQEHAFPSS